MLSHLIAFAAGALLVWFFGRRAAAAAASASANSGAAQATPAAAGADPMRAPDVDLDASIIEYIGENQVYHINDICEAIEHPKGSRFVRAHVHLLLEQGKIRYYDMLYRV